MYKSVNYNFTVLSFSKKKKKKNRGYKVLGEELLKKNESHSRRMMILVLNYYSQMALPHRE